jgi:hypothetical protein
VELLLEILEVHFLQLDLPQEADAKVQQPETVLL